MIPAGVLLAEGVVVSPELDAVGVVFGVLGPDDFPGLDDHSSGPTATGPGGTREATPAPSSGSSHPWRAPAYGSPRTQTGRCR